MTTPQEPPVEGQPYYADPSAAGAPYTGEPPVYPQQQQYPAAQYPPPGYQQPGYPPPAYGQPPYPYPYPPARSTNGMAIASMVLGIVWVYWIGSILALIFGYLALKDIREKGQAGEGMAIAGIVLGWIGVGILAIVLLLVATRGFS